MLSFDFKLVDDGIIVFLEKEKRNFLLKKVKNLISIDQWSKEYEHKASGMAKILMAVEDGSKEVKESHEKDGYWLSYQFLAELSEHQAKAINLPESVPYQIRTELNGPIFREGTLLVFGWYDSIGRPVRATQHGSILVVGDNQFRIPEPLYSAIQSFKAFNNSTDLAFDERMLSLSGLSEILNQPDQKINWDSTLKDLRISHASSFSVHISIENQEIKIDPVLFSKDTILDFSERGVVPDEKDQMLTGRDQKLFLEEHFNRSDTSKKSYALTKNHYVFIDPMVRASLEAVKFVQNSDAQTRKRFAKSPVSFIKDFIPDSDLLEKQDAIESTFIETESYSNRVVEIGIWVPPALPMIKKTSNNWEPDILVLRVGDQFITISNQGLPSLIKKVSDALLNGKESVSVTVDDHEFYLRADADTVDSLNALAQYVKPDSIDQGKDDMVDDPEYNEDKIQHPLEKKVLIVEDNYEELHFAKVYEIRCPFVDYEPPLGLLNKAKQHQVKGITWMQEAWSKGYPGLLLADDMGLGKTFQAIAFFSWLHEKIQSLETQQSPILIVAPVSLLGNWEKEVKLHLNTTILGEPVTLYGAMLKNYRNSSAPSKGSDVSLGMSVLDTKRLAESNWILTTYETLRDYQFSFASLKLSCVVFDEMQKIKNPKSSMTNAAKVLNADFSIGLTGTPIENSMADLWAIMDNLIPGCLAMTTLKKFMEKYSLENLDNLKELSQIMLERQEDMPPPILRRMKSDIAGDLPRKIELKIVEQMPAVQAQCYKEVIDAKKAKKISGLNFIHSLKMTSIHPFPIDSEASEEASSYIALSAKYKALFKVLDEAHEKSEKVLVFIEYTDIHGWLAFYIKERYSIGHFPERIFGGISAVDRTKIVDRFQQETNEFDLLLLSPKAAGVGLTLTQASKVIHFTRWWNPAVEDQCTDRAYRIGQTKDVTVYYPIAEHPVFGEGSFDYILDNMLNKKRELSKEFLVPMLSDRYIEDLEAILSLEV